MPLDQERSRAGRRRRRGRGRGSTRARPASRRRRVVSSAALIESVLMAKAAARARPRAVLETRRHEERLRQRRARNEAPARPIARSARRDSRRTGWMELQSPVSAARSPSLPPPMSALAPARPIGLDAPTFAGLNPAQRAARSSSASPRATAGASGRCWSIAGAGSGKTLTLAARVARLVLAGADPARILMLTFSRRAAAEMERRVGRVLHEALGLAPAAAARRAWPGAAPSTRSAPACCARHAAALGLDPSFTVDDRADSEDLIHVLRQRLGLAASRRRFPQKATCLAIYSRVVNAAGQPGRGAGASAFPWCADAHDDAAAACSPPTPPRSRRSACSTSTTCSSGGPRRWPSRRRRGDGGALRPCAGRRVPGHQSPAGRRSCSACSPDGRGLTVVGDDAQSIYSFRAAEVRNILDFAGRFAPPARCSRSSRTTARRRRCSPPRTRSSPWPPSATPRSCGATGRRSSGRRSSGSRTRASRGGLGRRARSWRCARSGLALKSQAVLFRSAQHSDALELELARRDIPFVKYGGLKFLEAAHVKDVLAVLRFAANPRGERAAWRALQLVPGIGAATAGRLIARDGRGRRPGGGAAGVRAGAGGGAGLVGVRGAVRGPARARRRPGRSDSPRSSAGTGRCSSGCTTTPRRAPPTSPTWCGWPRAISSRDRFLTELALDPPAATSDESGPGGARRGLPDPVDHPFGQGTGVERGLGAQRRRRLHPLGHGDRQRRRDRGGAAPALRRDDARAPSPAPARAAALLRDPAGGATATATCTRRSAASCRSRSATCSSTSVPTARRLRERAAGRQSRRVDIGARVRAAWR